MKYEYKSYACKPIELDEILNKASQDGWEIIWCLYGSLGRVLVITRKKAK